MSCIWAVARNMLAESIRMKIALVFIAIILILLPALPFVCAGDGLTLKSRVQSFLVYSLGAVGFLLSLLTVFLSCASVSSEIQQKSITMIVSKPIARWQFFVGKWLGISLLNAGLLFLTGLSVWGFTYYLKNRPTNVPADREALEYEVLTVRHGIPLHIPDYTAHAEERMRQMREEGRLEDVTPSGEASLRAEIIRGLERSHRALGVGRQTEFVFKGLLVNREEGFVHVRLKPSVAPLLGDEPLKVLYQCGDPNDPNTMTPTREWEILLKRTCELPVPTYAVNEEGTLYVRLLNTHPQYGVTFEGEDGVEVLFGIGTFHWNLFRALSIIWCRLAFLAVAGVLMSTFLSFPVACMACFLVFFVASSAGFLASSLEAVRVQSYTGEDPLWVLGPVARSLGSAFIWLVPDFSKHDAVESVANGRNVPLKWVMVSLVTLVLIKSVLLGVLGCVVFTRRELAQSVA